MPCADGLTVALELRKQVPRCRPLILTALDQPGHLRRARTHGVSGYLLKSNSPEPLRIRASPASSSRTRTPQGAGHDGGPRRSKGRGSVMAASPLDAAGRACRHGRRGA
ncbi:hypothetical protein CLM84_31325 [Streptomyces albidoflavus]|nr:hypothetical protein CLM84_31325 [Streptomyces albidoflavus]